MDSNYSLADIRAATRDDHDDDWGNGNGGWFWIVVLFLFMFGFGGNGMWGNNGMQGALTRSDLCEGFNFQNIENGIRGLANGLCDGFYAVNTSILQTGNSLGTQILENRFAAKECCCETNRNIDAVRYEAQKNTCDITTAIHNEGEQTRALINANTMQALRDKLADKDRDILARDMQLSQMSQTATLVGELRPCAKPAYLTCSPYQSAQYPYGYGYNRGRCGDCDCGGNFA